MTKETTNFVYVTYIRSTPQAVFDAVTKPEITSLYWGHKNVSDWKSGSDWQHIRSNEEQTIQVVGKVIEASPPNRLVLSWTSPSKVGDPDSLSRVTFDIAEYDSMVRLTVTHDDLEAGSAMASGVKQGWPSVLSSLKSFLETGSGIDVFAKPKTV